MRTTGSQLLSSITFVTVFITIDPYHSQAMMDFTSWPSLFTTAPGLLEDEDASRNQTGDNTLGSAMISPADQAKTSKVSDPLFNDTAVSTSSAMETLDSLAKSLQGDQNATDPSGFASLHANWEETTEESSNTTHPSFNLIPKLGPSSNDSDDLRPSDLWNTSSIIHLPDASQRRHEYADNYMVTTMSSTRPDHKISAHETWLMKKKLKGLHLADQHRVTGKMLALFLCISGILVCLLMLVYFIYNRTYKNEMFSHQRLYGESFEDPVLSLDTSMDHYDFFYVSDTQDHSDHTPQQLSNAKGTAPPPQTGSSHCEKQRDVLQMESVVVTPNKNFV